jgi:hypothetical protein
MEDRACDVFVAEVAERRAEMGPTEHERKRTVERMLSDPHKARRFALAARRMLAGIEFLNRKPRPMRLFERAIARAKKKDPAGNVKLRKETASLLILHWELLQRGPEEFNSQMLTSLMSEKH